MNVNRLAILYIKVKVIYIIVQIAIQVYSDALYNNSN